MIYGYWEKKRIDFCMQTKLNFTCLKQTVNKKVYLSLMVATKQKPIEDTLKMKTKRIKVCQYIKSLNNRKIAREEKGKKVSIKLPEEN